MTEIIEKVDDNICIQKRYLERVNVFFTQVKNWLIDTPLETVESPERIIADSTGSYQAGMMHIVYKDKLEPEDFVAEIYPMGATTLVGEGALTISGFWSEEKLIYLHPDTLQQVEYKPGVCRPMYKGVDVEGWYWRESSISKRVLLITRERFFDLIRMVSFHEFT